MESLNTQLTWVVVAAFITISAIAALVVKYFKTEKRNSDGKSDEITVDKMMQLRENTKDMELREDDPMLLNGEAEVSGLSTDEIEADQPKVVKDSPKTGPKKKKASKKKTVADKILAVFKRKSNRGKNLTTKEIQKSLKDVNSSTVSSCLVKLVRAKKIKKVGRGTYSYYKG